jgi:drug/metabolite transporter (DMT)-like permease
MDYEQKLCLGYKEALTQLRQHPNIIWTRNSFFLIIQSGLLAFTLNIENQPDKNTRLMACIAGLFIAFAWLCVNWAGRGLQRQWRAIVLKFEEELFDKEEGEQKVIGPFHRAIEMEGKYISVSITLILIVLSSVFIVLWGVILLRIYL